MTDPNPYVAPTAALADPAGEIQPVRVFSISGRIGRARYIAYGFGFYLMLGVIAAIAAFAGEAGIALIIAAWVAFAVIAVMLTIQRCHDFNSSGWLALLMFVPLANLIFLFVPGTKGPNRFGGHTPPNSVGVLIVAWLLPAVFVIGIIAAIAIPAYVEYQQRATGQVQMR